MKEKGLKTILSLLILMSNLRRSEEITVLHTHVEALLDH
jgi:hypothetical protein